MDQQLTATVNSVTTSYAYNAQGIRTAKQTGIARTDYLLDGGNVIGEVKNGTISAQYLRGFNLISREAEETAYYLFNAHGDVVNLTDSTGAVTKTYDYDAFGNEIAPDSADSNPFRYCGEYWDSETATYYLRARYYAPSIGRFTQADTHWNTANMIYGDNPQKINEREDKLGLKTYSYAPQISAIVQSGNLYVYCGSNPVYYSDPTGKMIGSAVLGGAAAAGAANAWNPVGWVILGGVIVVGGVVSAIKLAQLLDEVYGKPQVLAAKRDSGDVDWNANEHRKDHIWRGTNNKHLKGWRNLGFDPKDPKSWNKLLPILKEVYEKGKEIKTSQNENGIIHRIQYYVDELGQTITVVIRETLEGKLILSDAWVE